MNRDSILNLLRQNKGTLEKKYPLKSLALFGSYARNEQNTSSDVDVLVEFSQPVGMEFINLSLELEELLHIKVDLVSRKGIKPHYLPYIEEDLIYV